MAKVFDRTAPELWRVASHLCRDRHAAEDAVQNTFLVAIEHKEQWDGSRPLLPWLLGLLANRAREQRRLAAPRLDPTRVGGPQHEPDPAVSAQRVEFGQALHRALREVAEPYRSTLEQHLVHGVATSELADRLGVSAGSVRMRLHRGLDLLRRRLPVGFVAGGALVLAPVQLSAMRAAVLANVPGGGKAVVVGGLFGALLTKYLLMTMAACLGVVALAWAAWSRSGEVGAASPASASEVRVVAQDVDAARPSRRDVASRTDAEPIVRQAAPAIPGGLRVVLRNGGTQEPVVGAVVKVTLGALRHVQVLAPKSAEAAPGAEPATVTAVAARDVQTATTDAAGVATFELPPGPAEFTIRDLSAQPRAVTIAAGEVLEQSIELPVLVDADVAVIDADGRPAAAARILGRKGFYLGSLEEVELGTTDAHGRWRAQFLERSVLVRAVRTGHAASDAAVLEPRKVRTTLRLGGPAATVRGTVLALDGRPLPGAGVAIRSAAAPVPLVVRTGDDGTFVCDYVTPGPCLVYAWHLVGERQRFAIAEVEAEANATTDVVVRFERGASIVAEVRRPDGSAIDGVVVLATPERRLGAGFDLGGTARTGAGRCVIDGLLPGRYELRAQFGSDVHTETVELASGQEHRFVSVFDTAARLDLQVVDAGGAPLAGWSVDAVAADLDPMERGAGMSSSTTDAEGRVRLRGVPARRLLVTVRRQARGLVALAQEVDPAWPMRLVVTDTCAGTLRGVLVPAVGAALPELDLSLQRMPDATTPQQFDPRDRVDVRPAPDGSFTFARLPAGRYAFGALDRDAMRIVCWRLDLEVRPGGTVDLGRIEIAPGTIRVHASRDDGRAVADLVVSLGRRGDGAFGGFGGFGAGAGPGGELQDLAAGDYDVLVWGADIAPTRVPVTVAPGAVVDLPVTARTAIPVTFRCIDLPESATFGSVQLHRNGAALVAYLLPAAGAPHTRGLSPGSYRFEFKAGPRGELGRWAAEFEVGSAPVTVSAVRVP